MDEVVEYIKILPWKDWGGVIIGGLGALLVAAYTQWDKRRLAREEREAQETSAREVNRNALEVSQGQDLTARFKALMDGYEGRIRDLTTELATSRIEVSALRKEMQAIRDLLTAHQDKCRSCPYLVGLESSNAG